MAKQTINIGTLADDGTGDTLRAALDKCNDNFTELYALTDGTGAASVLTLAAGATSLGDTTISDASPTLIFKDSDCDDSDNNATIAIAATDTGTGAEDIDVTFSQQAAGDLVSFLASDANGSLTLGRLNQPIILNGVVASSDATIESANPMLTFKDSDCADTDANAWITADATDPDSGKEDVDIFIYQQVNGSGAACFHSDADGALTLGFLNQPIVLNGTVGDLTIKDTTPVLAFKDSNCAVSDVNAYIEATATDTDNGSEDIDIAIYQQVGGNAVACFASDADGLLTLGYGGQTVYSAKFTSIRPVTSVTTTASPANTDSGTVYNNIGDSDGATITLPTCAAGLQFTACVMVAQTLTVTAGSGDLIRIAGNVTAAAGSITSNVVGSSITLIGQDTETWLATSSVGSWNI
jgi:hypothetical protein